MKGLWSRLGMLWCSVMHPAPLWPRNGYYRCPKCMRRFEVPWEKPERIRGAARRA